MATLILFLGVQLSGKTTLAKRIIASKGLPYVAIDQLRMRLYGFLSGPQQWTTPELANFYKNQNREAYDILFAEIKDNIRNGTSLIAEMPHLGDREESLREFILENKAEIKIVWCYISEDNDDEIRARIECRKNNPQAATVRLEDYRIFKSKIKKPKPPLLEVDTSKTVEECLLDIKKFLF